MKTIKILYGNAGRGSAAQVQRTWENLSAIAQDVDVCAFVEVDEGDKGYSDHAFIRRFFAKAAWRYRQFKQREPLLVSRELTIKKSGSVHAGDAVAKWSPHRVDDFVIIDGEGDPDIEVDVTHLAAGTHNQAKNRPTAVRLPLLKSWRKSRARLKLRARRAYKKGRHFIAVLDANTPEFKPLVAHQTWLFRAGPDVGLVIPAPGWRIKDVQHEDVAMFIEKFHQGHKVTVDFATIQTGAK